MSTRRTLPMLQDMATKTNPHEQNKARVELNNKKGCKTMQLTRSLKNSGWKTSLSFWKGPVLGDVLGSFRGCIAFSFTRRRGQVSDCFKTGYSDSLVLQVENIIDEYVYIYIMYYMHLQIHIYIFIYTCIQILIYSTYACTYIHMFHMYLEIS